MNKYLLMSLILVGISFQLMGVNGEKFAQCLRDKASQGKTDSDAFNDCMTKNCNTEQLKACYGTCKDVEKNTLGLCMFGNRTIDCDCVRACNQKNCE